MMKSEQQYKAGSECELNSWSDSSVGQSISTEFIGGGFKSHLGQLFIASSKSIYIYIYTHTHTNIYIYIYIIYICTYMYLSFFFFLFTYPLLLHSSFADMFSVNVWQTFSIIFINFSRPSNLYIGNFYFYCFYSTFNYSFAFLELFMQIQFLQFLCNHSLKEVFEQTKM